MEYKDVRETEGLREISAVKEDILRIVRRKATQLKFEKECAINNRDHNMAVVKSEFESYMNSLIPRLEKALLRKDGVIEGRRGQDNWLNGKSLPSSL
ncbi:MAG: hypothetical protein U9Q21_00855 [Candidatus Auribacterota bacterium]|nr:hypothetical protein [Candidatus Auribacterota bacterium]